MNIPVSPRIFKRFLKMKVRGGCDFREVHGWKVKSEADPRWLLVDGKMDEIEKNVEIKGATWLLTTGRDYGSLIRMVLNQKQDGSYQDLPFSSDFFYVDDDLAPDPPEFVPGQSPNVGFWFPDVQEIKKGTYFFFLMIYVIDEPYRENLEVEYLNIMDHRVKTIVNQDLEDSL